MTFSKKFREKQIKERAQQPNSALKSNLQLRHALHVINLPHPQPLGSSNSMH